MNQPLVVAKPKALVGEQRCEICKFYKPVNGRRQGECRRHPPSIAPIGISGQVRFVTEFPAVDPETHWCGDYVMSMKVK